MESLPEVKVDKTEHWNLEEVVGQVQLLKAKVAMLELAAKVAMLEAPTRTTPPRALRGAWWWSAASLRASSNEETL